MSAIEDMIGKMLAKALPPEIMAMLTPEKIQAFGDGINKFVTETRENQITIDNKLDQILANQEREKLTLVEISGKVEKCLKQKP